MIISTSLYYNMYNLIRIRDAFPAGYICKDYSYFCRQNEETMIVTCRFKAGERFYTLQYDPTDSENLEVSEACEEEANAFAKKLTRYFLTKVDRQDIGKDNLKSYFDVRGSVWCVDSSKKALLCLLPRNITPVML